MPFEFTCPFCHTRTKVDDKFSGQSGPCVSCGKTITLPASRNGSKDSTDNLADSRTTSKTQRDIATKSLTLLRGSMVAAILLGLLAVSVVVASFSLPYAKRVIVLSQQRQDLTNMRKIVQALNGYADRYGTYPPPVVTDGAGKPLYSWRVLLLPFLGYQGQYDKFALDQAYDSPANIEAGRIMPVEYQSVQLSNQLLNNSGQSSCSNFVLVTGVGTMFPPTGPLAREGMDIPTIILVETSNFGQEWTVGGGLDVKYGARPGTRENKDFGGVNPDSFLAVSVDETTYIFPNSVPGTVLDGLISPLGKEAIDAAPFIDLHPVVQ